VWELKHHCSKLKVNISFHIAGLSVGRVSSVGIATRYGSGDPGIESRCGKIFRTCPDRPWGPPSLLYNGYRVYCPVVKRPGRDVDHPPPPKAKVKEIVELYLYSPSGPSWPVLGWTVPLLYRYSQLVVPKESHLHWNATDWSLTNTCIGRLHQCHLPSTKVRNDVNKINCTNSSAIPSFWLQLSTT
jgi:hypothetical protein